MGLKLFKKKNIPEELPDLATDTLNKTSNKEIKKDQEIVNNHLMENENKIEPKKETPEIEDGFFNKLQKDINSEISNLNKLEDWYNNKFLPQDTVLDMRKYWEKQKTGSIIKIMGGRFKEEISEKTANLQKIEREWQDIYFQLMEKEEEIRKEEHELKKILAEFVDICKKRKKRRK